MDAGENDRETPEPVSAGKGHYSFTCNVLLNVLIALSIGIISTLLLTSLKHNIGFALLSGLFAAILYGLRDIPRIPRYPEQFMRRMSRSPSKMHSVTGDSEEACHFYKGLVISAITYGLLGVSAFVGLYYLPDQYIILTLISAVFMLMLFHCLFNLGSLVLMFLFGHKGQLGTDEEQRKWHLDI